MKSRREFVKFVAVAGTLTSGAAARVFPLSRYRFADSEDAHNPWNEVAGILARIKPPVFANRDFDITKFGAVANNKTDNTDAFRNAIAACNRAGGGRVVVPKGDFLSGALHLKSNVNLHIESGATIRFSRQPSKYPIVFTRFEGTELMNYSPFIYAFEQENIAITGDGTLDGNADADHWWAWKKPPRLPSAGPVSATNDRELLFQMAEKGVPVSKRVFGEGHYLRPQFIQPYRCKNILIEGVTLLNSPMWQIHPVLCTNVTVRNLKINADGPNTDGCDPESCSDVLIKGCIFNTGDDCIAIKSGRNADGRRVNVPTQNIVIQDCHMNNGHGGVTIGSEISGGVRGVFAENCQMDSPKLNIAIRLKNNAMRGGVLENIFVRNINVGQVADAAVAIDFYYEEGQAGQFTPVVRNVSIEKVKTSRAKYAVYLRGFANAPIEKISFVDCDFEGVQQGSVVENVRDISVRNVLMNGKPVDRIS
ncbi:MAG: exopolygalacturonase PelB [Candidatus Acidiferrum sp.]